MNKHYIMPKITKKIFSNYILPITLLLSTGLNAQESIDQLQVPSPNVTSLGKYVDTPVGYYTGIPSITIPVHTIQAKEFSLPVQLSYHAGGIKVSEEASWVGLGWSLMAGGAITRSIRGLDDFGSGGYPFVQNTFLVPDQDNNINMLVAESNRSQAVSEFLDHKNGITDAEPDIFYFNFAGFSGKFFFEKCGTCIGNEMVPVLQNDDNLDVIYNKNTQNWTVTDVYGNQYILGTKEQTEQKSQTTDYELPSHLVPVNYVHNGPKTTSWFLDEIITNKGEVIYFDYNDPPYTNNDTPIYTSQSQLSRSQKITRLLDLSFEGCPGTHSGCSISNSSNFGNYQIVHSAHLSFRNDVYLEKIRFPNGVLEFEKSPRIDIKKYTLGTVADPQKLVKIKLYQSNNSIPIKTWELHQSYFQKAAPEITEYYRLKLDSLSIKSINEEKELPPYTFKYFESKVPSKLTKDVDHWGYFNNAGNDSRPDWGNPPGSGNKGTMIPTITYGDKTYNGANREVNFEMAKTFTLNEISFPTGGKHSYSYESNEYYNLNPVTEVIIKSEPLFPSITTCETEAEGSVVCTSNAPEKIIEFEVTNNMVNNSPTREEGYIIANFNFYIDGNINGCSNNSNLPLEGEELAHVYPISQPGANFTGSTTLRINYPNKTDLPYGCFENTDYYEYDSSFDSRCTNVNDTGCSRDLSRVALVPGWYRLKLNAKRNYLESFAEAFFEQEEIITNDGNQLGGGLRVSKITLDSGNDIPKIVKAYEYALDDKVQSSGVLMSPPLYFKTNTYFEDITAAFNSCVITCSYAGKFIEATSNSISPLSNSAKGNFVGYTNVKEYFSENGKDNGYNEYVFNNLPDVLDPFIVIPGLPTLPNLNNGLLKDVYVYDSSDKKKRWEHYTYSLDGQENILKGLTIHDTYIPSQSEIYIVNFSHFYDINYQWYKMTSKETIDYDENQNPLVTRKQNYVYNSNNKLPRSISEDINEGDVSKTIQTLYEYAQDFGTIGTSFGSDILRDRKMFGQVLREKRLFNDVEIFQKENYYDLINNNALVSEIKVYPKGIDNADIFTNIKYDQYSNASEILREDSTPTSAIWGYDHQYVVAKVHHASLTDIESTLTAVELSNIESGSYDEDTMRSILNKIRIGLPDAMVTTYTYDPLIGVTSITDPRGYTIYYEYDDFNRLKAVKDAQGNLVEDYEYHYRGEQ